MLSFLKKQFLPVGLIAVALVGFFFPAPGLYVAQRPAAQFAAIAVIFVCAGLALRTDEIRAALSAWSASLWGLLSILLVTPVVGGLIAFQLPLDPSFQLGLALFCAMPTTVSSGIALTAQARGNVALALLLTVSTNLIGVFSVPFVLALLLESAGQVELSAGDLLVKLCLFILLPLLAGKFLQRFIGEWAQRNRANLTMLSNAALISIPWTKISESSQQLAQIALTSLLVLAVFGLLIHIVYLLLNDGVCRALRFALPLRKAVVLMASQKTLPVAMTVLAFLPVPAETKGLIAIPCITFHLGQIFLDAVIATRWGSEE